MLHKLFAKHRETLLLLNLFLGDTTVRELDKTAALSQLRGDSGVVMAICLSVFLCVYQVSENSVLSKASRKGGLVYLRLKKLGEKACSPQSNYARHFGASNIFFNFSKHLTPMNN